MSAQRVSVRIVGRPTTGREHHSIAKMHKTQIVVEMSPLTSRKRLAEEEQQELEDFRAACQLPGSEGVPYAVEKLGLAQADVKEQFKEVFLELKQSLEVCFLIPAWVGSRSRRRSYMYIL